MSEPTEKKTFDQFLATVPEAPSSSKDAPAEAEEAPAADDPKAGATSAEASKAAGTASSPASKSAPATGSPADGEASLSTGQSPEIDPATLRAALKSGDLDALAEALGEDPALYSEKSTKWAAARRKEQKLKSERDRVAQQAEAIVKRTQPVFDLAAAVQAGDFTKLPELVEFLCHVDYDAAILKTARARHGSDPQVEVLKRRVAELEPVVAESATAKASAAEKAFLETLRDEVATGHQVREFEEWESKVAAVLRESVDEDLGEPTLSVKQAADRVLRREREAFERRAKVFAGGTKPAKNVITPRAPERASGAVGTPKRKLTRDEWLAAQK